MRVEFETRTLHGEPYPVSASTDDNHAISINGKLFAIKGAEELCEMIKKALEFIKEDAK